MFSLRQKATSSQIAAAHVPLRAVRNEAGLNLDIDARRKRYRVAVSFVDKLLKGGDMSENAVEILLALAGLPQCTPT